MNGDASQGGDGVISGALVEANVISENGTRGGGAAINADGVCDSVFCNNLLINNHARGIALFRGDGASGSKNNVVAHNTIVQASDGHWAVICNGASTGNRVVNNIVYSSTRRGSLLVSTDSVRGLVSDHNLLTPRLSADYGDRVLDLQGWRALGFDLHSLAAPDPSSIFVDHAGGDYHLRAGSLAIDAAGLENVPALDLYGNRRPRGSAADIGACEFSATAADSSRTTRGRAFPR
jgi:hypothetical protein